MITTAHGVGNAILVEIQEYNDGTKCAVVDLHGESHYDLFQHYKSLPDVIQCGGVFYGKSGWDSDRCKGYYRSDITFAKWKNM